MCFKKRNNSRLQQHLSCSKVQVYFSVLKIYLKHLYPQIAGLIDRKGGKNGYKELVTKWVEI